MWHTGRCRGPKQRGTTSRGGFPWGPLAPCGGGSFLFLRGCTGTRSRPSWGGGRGAAICRCPQTWCFPEVQQGWGRSSPCRVSTGMSRSLHGTAEPGNAACATRKPCCTEPGEPCSSGGLCWASLLWNQSNPSAGPGCVPPCRMGLAVPPCAAAALRVRAGAQRGAEAHPSGESGDF